jgi:hypothetical protein
MKYNKKFHLKILIERQFYDPVSCHNGFENE